MSTSTRLQPSLLAEPSRYSGNGLSAPSEVLPLLNRPGEQRSRKSLFFRPRPLWLVPFAIVSSIVRSMTLAPRVEIYTQLSCNSLHGTEWNHTESAPATPSLQSHPYSTLLTSVDATVPHIYPSTFFPPPNEIDFHYNSTTVYFSSLEAQGRHRNDRLPSSRCASDPAVQAGAARLQTIMTTTMGFLSALTSGWWGTYGERHGRTKVLAISTFGLLLTDLVFVLISTPSLPFSRHGHKLLIFAPIVEGLLGGSSTLQAAISSYVTDCTPPGSRAHIFSRFTGLFYIGFSIGPSIAGYLVQHPINLFGNRLPVSSGRIGLSVFWVAIVCSVINFLLALFIFPESLGKDRQERAKLEYNALGAKAKGKARMAPMSPIDEMVAEISVQEAEIEEVEDKSSAQVGMIMQLLKPLAIFLPVLAMNPSGIAQKRRDWNLTLLAVVLFGFMLSTGIFQMRYLYATHSYSWGVQQLSYFISFMGGLKAAILLMLLPAIITVFKQNQPTVTGTTINVGKGKRAIYINIPPTQDPAVVKPNTKPSRAQLGRDLSFDLTLTRVSLLINIVAHTLVAIVPAPAVVQQLKSHRGLSDLSPSESQTAFIAISSLNCFGAGVMPVAHSLALSLMQLRGLDAKNLAIGPKEEESTGELFGALAVLQAVGQTILAPILFGTIYSRTVARFPKAIFVTAAVLCLIALIMLSFVENPVARSTAFSNGRVPMRRRRREIGEVERGRSRVSKDLRGGAIPYYPHRPYGTMVDNFPDASERV